MSVASLFRVIETGNGPALVWRTETWSYTRLFQAINVWSARLGTAGVEPDAVVTLEADFTPQAIAAFLALVRRGSIVVPLASHDSAKIQELAGIAQSQWSLAPEREMAEWSLRKLTGQGKHELYDQLRSAGHPGLVLFSSGSTGIPKGVLHDVNKMLAKFEHPRRQLRTLAFLLFDHIGGMNTLFYTLSNTGCLVIAEDRSPDAVLSLVERHAVELLPTSPTFLNMVVMSGADMRHDLTSLRLVTYGTESMPQSVINAIHRSLPRADLLQTYGLSELGILRSKSKAPDSLWVKIGGPEFQTRIVDGVLQVKADSPMLGYLNAPSPFLEGGWFDTGDRVAQDGEYIRFIGRMTDVINVGGEKVFPIEVEETIRSAENVGDVLVYGKSNRLVGSIVACEVVLLEPEDPNVFQERIATWCAMRLAPYKLPVEFKIVERIATGERFKRSHRIDSAGGMP